MRRGAGRGKFDEVGVSVSLQIGMGLDELALSRRTERAHTSQTAQFFERGLELAARGHDVLSFAVGEPDFDTPRHIVEAAQRAVAEGATRYTAVAGIRELREAICADSARRRPGTAYTPEHVVVCAGAKHALMQTLTALFDEGDEVIVPTPCWGSYIDQIRLCGATPVMVRCGADTNFKLTPEALEGAITDRTRGLMLCTPDNPTGEAFSRAELAAIAEVVRRRPMWTLVDEIYGELVYGDFRHTSWAEVAPDLFALTVIADGVSKRYAMTGFRVGWILAPERVAQAVRMVQSQGTTCVAGVTQHAALEALRGPQDCAEQMRRAFERRRRLVVEGLNAIDGIHCRWPAGAFYAFPDVSGLLGRELHGRRLQTDADVVELWLEQEHVVLVPGSAFYSPGFVRLSYTASERDLERGLERMARALR